MTQRLRDNQALYAELYGHVSEYEDRSRGFPFAERMDARKALIAMCLDAVDRALTATGPGSGARPLEEWHEGHGPALWWKFPIVEPPYSGDPRDDDFPDYVTHWTSIVMPASPQPAPEGETTDER